MIPLYLPCLLLLGHLLPGAATVPLRSDRPTDGSSPEYRASVQEFLGNYHLPKAAPGALRVPRPREAELDAPRHPTRNGIRLYQITGADWRTYSAIQHAPWHNVYAFIDVYRQIFREHARRPPGPEVIDWAAVRREGARRVQDRDTLQEMRGRDTGPRRPRG